MSSQTIDTTRIQPDGPGAYLVPSATNDRIAYRVSLSPMHCTCPAFAYRSGPCKHLTAVENLYAATPIDLEGDEASDVEAWYAKAKRLDLEDILARTCERMGGKGLEESPLGHLLQAWQQRRQAMRCGRGGKHHHALHLHGRGCAVCVPRGRPDERR